MNILPMVLVFITILTSLSYYSVSQTQFISQQQKLCTGFLQAQRSLINSRYKKIFKASKSLKEKKGTKMSQHLKPIRPKQGGILNFYYLLDPTTEKMAMSVLESFFTNAYGTYEPFEKMQNPSFVKEFILALKEQGKKTLQERDELTLVDLFPKDPTYRSLYYKMLKGTMPFKSKFLSYPSLEKICIIKNQGSSKFFGFSQLSYEQLSWIFKEPIASAIEKKEIEINQSIEDGKKRTLFKHEVEEILLHHRYKDASTLLSNISFNNPRPLQSALKGVDPSTQITLVWEDK